MACNFASSCYQGHCLTEPFSRTLTNETLYLLEGVGKWKAGLKISRQNDLVQTGHQVNAAPEPC